MGERKGKENSHFLMDLHSKDAIQEVKRVAVVKLSIATLLRAIKDNLKMACLTEKDNAGTRKETLRSKCSLAG